MAAISSSFAVRVRLPRSDPVARILFVVWGLGDGGAERQLVTLAKGLDRVGHEVAIAVWNPGGAYESELEHTRIRYEVVKLPRRLRLPRLVRDLRALAARFRPHVIHGYMESGNFLASLLQSPEPGSRLVWGVRASELERTSHDLSGRILYWMNRPLSRLADLVIANSRAGADYLLARNYPRGRVEVVYNGIDTLHFQHDERAGERLRASWGLRPEARVIGMAARLDPMKGHETFIGAAGLLAARCPEVRFVWVGEGIEPHRGRVLDMLRVSPLRDRLSWRGRVQDMAGYYSALDVATSSSVYGEGFSNSVAEAMACGIPCVVTDVGDSSHIVGKAGQVVRPGDARALADAWARALQSPRPPRAECRARVVENFSIARLVAASEALMLPPHLPRLAPANEGSV